MESLDLISARTAQEIIEKTKAVEAKDVENMSTKTLGVLQENGVYAAMLYLLSSKKKENGNNGKDIAKLISDELMGIKTMGLEKPAENNNSAYLKHLTGKVCGNLDKLLLTRQLWEQTLIYTRYGAKARKAQEGK